MFEGAGRGGTGERKMNENNKAGVITIIFKSGMPDEEIQSAINKLYADNQEIISGMTFTQIDTIEHMKKGMAKAQKYWESDND